MRQFGIELRKQIDNEFVTSVLFLKSVEFMCVRIPAVSI